MEQNAVIERVWYKDDYVLVIVFHPKGYRCGYVGIPKGKPHYYEFYDKLQWDGSAELSYADDVIFGLDVKDKWFIGFCFNDVRFGRDKDAMCEYYGREYMEDFYNNDKIGYRLGTPWTTDKVAEEVEKLYQLLTKDNIQ